MFLEVETAEMSALRRRAGRGLPFAGADPLLPAETHLRQAKIGAASQTRRTTRCQTLCSPWSHAGRQQSKLSPCSPQEAPAGIRGRGREGRCRPHGRVRDGTRRESTLARPRDHGRTAAMSGAGCLPLWSSLMTRPRHGHQVRRPVVSSVFRRVFLLHKQLKFFVAQRRPHAVSSAAEAVAVAPRAAPLETRTASAGAPVSTRPYRPCPCRGALVHAKGVQREITFEGSQSIRPPGQAARCRRTLRVE